MGLPKVSVSLFTQAIPRRDPSQGVVSRGLTAAGGQVMGLLMTRPYNKLRRSFGVKPLGPDGNLSPLLNLIPISPQLQPRDPLWVPQHQVTGYWFTDDPVGWQPDAALLEFLDRGGPIVAVSLGAMSLSSASHSASVVAKALHAAGLRAVVQGWQDVALPDTPDIYRAGSLPHRWLFSKVQAVIFYGGSATTAAASVPPRPRCVPACRR